MTETLVQKRATILSTPIGITTDREALFEPELFNNVPKLLGSNRICCAVHHRQGSEMAGRLHRQLKAALRSHLSQWTEFLPLTMLGITTAVETDSQWSTTELVLRKTLTLPAVFIILVVKVKSLTYKATWTNYRTKCSNLNQLMLVNSRERYMYPRT